MKFELFQAIEQLNIDSETWNELTKNNKTNSIFQTFEWFKCWWDSCGSDYQLSLIIGSENDQIGIIAPLMISIENNGKKHLRFAGDINSDYCDMIVHGNRENILAQTLDWILNSTLDFDRIILKNIPFESGLSRNFEHLCHTHGLYYINTVKSISPTLLLKDNDNFAHKVINKYSVKRHLNKIKRNGTISFKIIEVNSLDNAKQELNNFFQQHIKRFQKKNEPSLFTFEKYINFYTNLVEVMGKKKWLHFSTLEFNGKQVAYHIGFSYNNSFIWYKPSFDIDYSHFSPGSVLLRYLISYALENGYDEFDFSIGDEEYKNRYCNLIRSNDNLFIYKSRLDFYLHSIKRKISIFLNIISPG